MASLHTSTDPRSPQPPPAPGPNGSRRAFQLSTAPADPAAIAAIPRALAERLRVAPVERRGDILLVAMADTTDVHTVDELARISRCRIAAQAASLGDIQMAIMRFYGPATVPDREGPTPPSPARPHSDSMVMLGEDARGDDAPIIRRLNQVLTEAIAQRASDIHVEPHEHALVIRFRIDGILVDWHSLGLAEHPPLVSRIKILANMDIAKTRVPLDGRFTTSIGGQRWDVRVSTVPGAFGEAAVMRLLPKDSNGVALEQLGMQERQLKVFASLISKPYGMILVTGPTGAGKTTTLYTALQQMDCIGRKVITIEDPVEYELPRVTQIQVHPKIGLTFAAGLRHVLRQDPDVLMVGEIRDGETLEMAVQAALTGHLVFSTLHCNDAASAAARCLDMELEPFLFTSSVIGVVAQRLVRRICQRCRIQEQLTASVRERFGIPDSNAAGHRGVGCDDCRQTGYRGRMAVYEILALNQPVKEAIHARASASDVRRIAGETGMISLREDAALKIQLGMTTPEEALRAVYLEGE